MADETSASAMVTYFTTCTAQLRGRAVFIQFSNHKELKTDQTHSNAVSTFIILLFTKLLAQRQISLESTPLISLLCYQLFTFSYQTGGQQNKRKNQRFAGEVCLQDRFKFTFFCCPITAKHIVEFSLCRWSNYSIFIVAHVSTIAAIQ